MSTVDIQIKTAYEKERMSPAEIAEDQDLEEIAVKAKLMEISSEYRKACGMEPEDEDRLNFTNDQLERVNQVIYETALSAETPDGMVDYRTRLNAAIYIRDDKKGRKEVVKQVAGNTFNILGSFNEMAASARKLAEGIRNKQLGNGSVVEV